MKALATLDELDAFIVPLGQTRACARCGAWTWWAVRRQPKHGRCIPCMVLTLTAELTVQADARAEALLLRAFPGAVVEQESDPGDYQPGYGRWELCLWTDRWVSGKWTQSSGWRWSPEAGPCVRCRRSIRRYGPFGRALCGECEP